LHVARDLIGLFSKHIAVSHQLGAFCFFISYK